MRELLFAAVLLFVATTLNAQHASRDSSAALPKNAIKVNVFSAGGALLGYQALALHNHVSFDFFVGPNLAGHHFRTEGFINNRDTYNTYRMFNTVSMRSGFSVGFAF